MKPFSLFPRKINIFYNYFCEIFSHYRQTYIGLSSKIKRPFPRRTVIFVLTKTLLF
ncbi:hypothetical protein KsCSTR_15430 [Candidatus Kuenenia stuttgartiensis]|uniref:Uncharacterized protein n=1 Tax=Kuenenia stuttgartiensis TaxID=174633 RepID=Q1Q1L0_KUEST|nr:hypothetical protein KsCSTR_15430 [Candidatus Kuenenia stuttgartiensis]CAJ73898.1 unknown protein [Candidatus Kuenenia stuttgartiensis]